MPTVFTIDELAARWRVSYGMIYKMLTSGTLKGFRVGCNWRIPLGIVEAYEKGEA